MPHQSQGHGDSLDWGKDGGTWWARFFCPIHNHEVTLNEISARAGPGQTAELSGIKNRIFGGNKINHICFN